MGYKFNPFTGSLDTVDSPNGIFSEIDISGDITLDDGGTYTTTVQVVTPTADRTISFPDATGTVALVAGSNGQLIYNNAGAQSGLSTLTTDGTDITLSGRFISSLNGAADEPPGSFTGTWFTGGTATTTKPQLLIEPSGTTSTAWSTNGTGLGVNAATGFSGNMLDIQKEGVSRFNVNSFGTANLYVQAGFTNEGLSIGATNSAAKTKLSYQDGLFFSGAGTFDVVLRSDAAADTLAQRRSTNAQTFRVYDTYSSATDYHRIAIATARATLSAVSGASVTATGLIPAGAVVMGVTSKVTTGLGTTNSTTGYKIGTVADDDRWGDITGTAAGTSSDNRDWTAGTIECFPAATDIIVTAVGGNFDGTGEIYLSVQYMAGQAD